VIAAGIVVFIAGFCSYVRLRCRDERAADEAFSIAVLGAISGLVIARIYTSLQ
jgi:cytochrome bd-type quinol oxidase subunit 1